MAFVTDSNRLQPLWQPPPTACLTAAGGGGGALIVLLHHICFLMAILHHTEVLALQMQPWPELRCMPLPPSGGGYLRRAGDPVTRGFAYQKRIHIPSLEDPPGVVGHAPRAQGCIRREGTSEAAPEAVSWAVGGGRQSGWGRLLSVTNAVDAWHPKLPGTWRQGDSG